jgi:hypothetical protein
MFDTVTFLQALLVYNNQAYTVVMMLSLKDPWKLLYLFSLLSSKELVVSRFFFPFLHP